jgi:hypothetical protein
VPYREKLFGLSIFRLSLSFSGFHEIFLHDFAIFCSSITDFSRVMEKVSGKGDLSWAFMMMMMGWVFFELCSHWQLRQMIDERME